MWPAGRRSAPPGRTRSSPANLLRGRPVPGAEQDHHRHRQGAEKRRGHVEFSSDFFLIKPKQIERGNGTVLYEVSNRGGKGMLGFFNHAAGSLDPTTDAADGRRLPDEAGLHAAVGRLAVRSAAARRPRPRLSRRSPQTTAADHGLVRSDFVVTEADADASLADRDHIAYAVANPNDPANVLTVRDSVEGARRFIPKSEWKHVDGATRVYLTGGFEPGKIYEVVYTRAGSAGRRRRARRRSATRSRT